MRKCKTCGKDISDRSPQAQYCRECAVRKGRAEGHQILTDRKNGKRPGRITYGSKAYEILKREAHQAQGLNCIICGWGVYGVLGGGCIVHHITAVADGGDESVDNVAVLCPNCHSLAHFGLITPDELRGLAAIATRNRPTLEDVRKIINRKLRPPNKTTRIHKSDNKERDKKPVLLLFN